MNSHIVSAWRGMEGERLIFKDGTIPPLKRCVLMVGMPLTHNTAMTVHGFFEQSANERQQSMAETLLFFSFTCVAG